MSHLKYVIEKTYANAIDHAYVDCICMRVCNYVTNDGLLIILINWIGVICDHVWANERVFILLIVVGCWTCFATLEFWKSSNFRLPKCGLHYTILNLHMDYIVQVSTMPPSKYLPIDYRVNKWIVIKNLICDMIISYNIICFR